MSEMETKRRRLQRVLAQSHRLTQDGPPHPGPFWRQKVMAGVAALKERGPELDPWALMERLVWKLAPAAGALVLLTALLSGQVGSDPAAEMAATLSTASTDSGLYALYQSELLE